MNLNNKTKAELIEIIKTQKHLTQAVDIKDNNISDLKNRLGLLQKEYDQCKHDYEKKSRNSKESKDALEILIKQLQEKLKISEENNKILTENNKTIYTYIGKYRDSYRSLMQSVQGTIELSIDAEKYMTEKLFSETKKNNEGVKE